MQIDLVNDEWLKNQTRDLKHIVVDLLFPSKLLVLISNSESGVHLICVCVCVCWSNDRSGFVYYLFIVLIPNRRIIAFIQLHPPRILFAWLSTRFPTKHTDIINVTLGFVNFFPELCGTHTHGERMKCVACL